MDLSWQDGALAAAEVRSRLGRPCRVRSERPIDVTGPAGAVAVREESPNVYAFETESGQTYRVTASSR